MSAYAEFQTEFRDAEILKAALIELCPQWLDNIEDHHKPVSLVGYTGDERTQKAHLVIRRQHVGSASNDVGFEFVNGTFVARISAFDQRQQGLGLEWRKKLTVAYGRLMVAGKAKRLGYQVQQETRADGSVQMVLTR